MTDRRFPQKQSEEISDRLDPKLAKLCSQLPPAVGSRIESLVKMALGAFVHPNWVVKYAFLLATAEQQAHGDAVSEDHARRSKAELVGELHGYLAGYWHPAKAMELYRRGRRARQQIQASMEGCLQRWVTAEQGVRKRRPELPVYQQAKFSEERLSSVRSLLLDMARTTVLDDEIPGKKSRSREPNVITQTFIWWHFCIAPYNGKTNEMYELAQLWQLSAAEDLETFRSIVSQACRRAKQSMRYPIGSAWESVLSGTP